MNHTFSPRDYIALFRRNRNLRLLWFGGIVSMTADWFHRIALHTLILLFFKAAGDSGSITAEQVKALTLLWVTLAFMAQMFPPFIFSPFIGVLADRFSRRHIMMAADICRAFLAALFMLCARPELLWLMLALEVPLSVGAGFFDTAQKAMLPDMVDKQDLVAANGLLQSTWGITAAFGAFLGGIMIATVDPFWAFFLNSITFLFSLAMVRLLRVDEEHLARRKKGVAEDSSPGSDRGSFREGLLYVGRRKSLLALVSAKPGWALTGGMILTLHTLLGGSVFENWGRPGLGIALLHWARGVGALVGTILAPYLFPVFRRHLLWTLSGVFLIYGIDYCYISGVNHVLTASFLLVIGTTLSSQLWILPAVILQQALPSTIRGRVFAIDQALSLVFLGISGFAAYALSVAGVEPRTIAFIAGLGLFGVGVAYVLSAVFLRIDLQELFDEARAADRELEESGVPLEPGTPLSWEASEPEFVGTPPVERSDS